MSSEKITKKDISVDVDNATVTIGNSTDVINHLIQETNSEVKTDLGDFHLSDLSIDDKGRLVVKGTNVQTRLALLKTKFIDKAGQDMDEEINVGSCTTGVVC